MRVTQVSQQSAKLVYGFAAVVVASCFLAAGFDSIFPLAIPAIALLGYVTIVDFRSVFFFLLACIPLSIEYTFPNGFGTDLPTEPLTVGLMLIYWIYVVQNGVILRGGHFLKHPITLLLLLHYAWIVVTTVNSENLAYSVKYLLAKTWYIVTFYFLAGLILRRLRDFHRFFWWIFIPLSIAVLITLLRHAAKGFAFTEVNYVMQPLFRNHVSYACILTIFLPFILLARTWYPKGTWTRWMLTASALMFLVAIQFSFTRAAYVAIVGALAFVAIVHFRLTRYVVVATIVGMVGFVGYIVNGNKYLDFAPNFERAVTHQRFDNLVEATAKGEDVSTMERVYRWVAGARMVAEKPWMGFGPGNFYEFYRSYTLTSFKTYVSDNKDQSTVHSYYLLIAIEEGIPGALIFFALIFTVLLRGEKTYHNSRWVHKGIVLAALSTFVIILQLILINDLIETDKVGSFFFMALAMIVNMDILTRARA